MKKLGFGLMRLPQVDPEDWYSAILAEDFKKMADAFIKKGFTYFDTAYIYNGGNSEKAFREAVVRRYPREAYTICDKLPMMVFKKEEDMAPIFAEMLANCGVSYFDYLWLHAITGPNYEKAKKFHSFEYLSKLKEEGKARHIGFSFHGTPELLDEVLTAHPEAEYVQLQINYLDWEDPTVQSRKCYEICVKHGKKVIVMEPVKGGALANVPKEAEDLFRGADPAASAASWAIRFAASLDNVMVVLSGMSSQEQLEDNTAYMEHFRPLSPEQRGMVMKAGEIIRKNIAIPCTACRYCIPVCPKQICIPDYFSIYNTIRRFGDKAGNDVINYYNNLTQMHGAPTDCIKCGQCEQRCPQHLPIRKNLALVAEEIKKFNDG